MKQPVFAPLAAGGGLVTGAAAILVAGYYITDCAIHARGRGACDEVVEAHAFPLLAGAAAVAGTVGGFFSLNTLLDRPDGPPVVPPRGLVVEDMPPVPAPHEPGLNDPTRLYPRARQLLQDGWTQKEVMEELNLSRYHVRRARGAHHDG
jgi:hypothetical protein